MCKKIIGVLLSMVLLVSAVCTVSAGSYMEGVDKNSITYEMTTEEDGRITVTVGVKNCNMQTFDIGIVYEGAAIDKKDIDWAFEFTDVYPTAGGVMRHHVNNKKGEYVVATGAVYKEDLIYTGPIFTATFALTEENAKFWLVRKTADYVKVEDMEKLTDPILFVKEEPVVYGDVDGDGYVSANDGLLCLESAANVTILDKKQTKAADVNGDHVVNAEDALLILQYAARIITNFPVECEI